MDILINIHTYYVLCTVPGARRNPALLCSVLSGFPWPFPRDPFSRALSPPGFSPAGPSPGLARQQFRCRVGPRVRLSPGGKPCLTGFSVLWVVCLLCVCVFIG